MKTIKCQTGEVVNSYSEYLQTEHWKKKKQGFKCTVKQLCMKCGTKDNLEVHHLTYRTLGREKNTQLCLLCRNCHQDTHDGGIEVLKQICQQRKQQRKEDIKRIKQNNIQNRKGS